MQERHDPAHRTQDFACILEQRCHVQHQHEQHQRALYRQSQEEHLQLRREAADQGQAQLGQEHGHDGRRGQQQDTRGKATELVQHPHGALRGHGWPPRPDVPQPETVIQHRGE
ncbi:hypothetical protein AZ16_0502, partial [Bordetella bronchiseptica B18-5 (C3)]